MTDDDLVPLQCRAATLSALATGFSGFGPANGEPEWLVSGIWLCTDQEQFLATASVDVRRDGYLARPLNIHSPQELAAEIKADLPDIEARLIARDSDIELPAAAELYQSPAGLSSWPAEPYFLSVLVRVARRASVTHRIACALQFTAEERLLLVGTDVASMAMVLSEDSALIDRYREDCEELSAADYLKLAGA